MKAQDLAHAIIDYAQRQRRPVNNISLQHLLFCCALSNYAAREGRLIEDEAFEAWSHGPVIRNIYVEFAHCGARDISKRFDKVQLMPANITKTLNYWLQRGPWDLIDRTCIRNGAWDRSRDPYVRTLIPESYIQEDAQTYGI